MADPTLNYTFTIGDRIKNQKPNIEILAYKNFCFGRGIVNAHSNPYYPDTCHRLCAQCESNFSGKCGATIYCSFHGQIPSQAFRCAGTPFIQSNFIGAYVNIPGHNHSETITITTDIAGIFDYSRQESAIIQVNGGILSTLASPLSIDGVSFIIAQVWWAPAENTEGQPNYYNQNRRKAVRREIMPLRMILLMWPPEMSIRAARI